MVPQGAREFDLIRWRNYLKIKFRTQVNQITVSKKEAIGFMGTFIPSPQLKQRKSLIEQHCCSILILVLFN